MAVVFEAYTEPARERAERWRHVLEQATGRLEPRGIPDRCVAGAMGAVSVVEMVAGGAVTDAAHFSRGFKRSFGVPPAEYRRLHGPAR